MLLQIPGLLDPAQLERLRGRLAAAPWTDGRATAGHQGSQVKHNRQLAEDSAAARESGQVVLAALERNALFISAALPARVYPPMFNRYEGGEHFGNHIDNAVRLLPGSGEKLRTDVSATLFLSEPASYDGGELLIETAYGVQSVKLAAGDLLLYPATSLHRVEPVTRGERLACFFWVQSMVSEETQRTLLFDLDTAIQRLTRTAADAAALLQLTGCYHNLLRQWARL